MMTVTLFTPDQRLIRGGVELLDQPGIQWIDVQAADEPTLQALATRYGLHRLAIEDCLHLGQRPKLEEYAGHHFVVLQAFSCDASDVTQLQLHEQHFFLGADWLISVHELPAQSLSEVGKRLDNDPQGTIGRGADFMLYLLADALMDLNFPVIDRFNEELEDLELSIFARPQQGQLERTFQLKRTLVQVRRVLSPQRDVVSQLARRGLTHVNERTGIYFRDVYDHLVRLYEQIDAARDLLGNAMDAYLSVVANRTGEITKQLTIFASIFLPLSFIVGFFGQNFEPLSNIRFFWGGLALMTLIPIALLLWFRRREWI